VVFDLSFVLVLGLLAACASPTPPPTPAAPTTAATSAPVDVTRAPAPTSPAPATATVVSKKGGDFKEVTTSDAKSFHVYQTTDTTSSSYEGNVFGDATLTKRDPNSLQLGPGLAESWTVSDDAKTYTFKLRKDLKWSDGSAMTAQDFAWTFEQADNPANKYPYIDNLKDIVSYKALDDYTIQVVLTEGTCVGLSTADAVTPLPKAVWSKLDWSDPTKNPEIQNPSVVSGFFKLKEWKRDDHATFVRNDLFYRGAPNLDSDTVRIVPNTSVQFQMLKTGEVDYAPVSASDYAEAQKTDTLKEYDWAPAVATYDFLGFNLRRPHLQDVEVRHALSYAIPRQAIVDKVFNGLAKPTYSAFTPTSWVYNPDVPHYDYSTDTAKATLDKAGYKLDANGKLLGKDGKPFPKLKILFNTGNKQREQIATIAQEEFKKLGIDVEVTGMEFQAELQFLQTAPFDYDLYVLGWRTTFEPYFSYQIWSESTIPALNSGAYINKQVESLFEQSNHPPCDAASRKKPFQQIQQIISTESPYIFLDFRTGYEFLNKRVVPNDPGPLGVSYFLEQWYLKSP
jgi:peptide/nickel transport system substrate-binding protein